VFLYRWVSARQDPVGPNSGIGVGIRSRQLQKILYAVSNSHWTDKNSIKQNAVFPPSVFRFSDERRVLVYKLYIAVRGNVEWRVTYVLWLCCAVSVQRAHSWTFVPDVNEQLTLVPIEWQQWKVSCGYRLPQMDGGWIKLWQTDRSLQLIFRVSVKVVRFWSAFGFDIRSFLAF